MIVAVMVRSAVCGLAPVLQVGAVGVGAIIAWIVGARFQGARRVAVTFAALVVAVPVAVAVVEGPILQYCLTCCLAWGSWFCGLVGCDCAAILN